MKPGRNKRMDDLIAEAGLVPFYRDAWVNPRTGRVDSRVLGERPAYRFLVAQDEWARTFAPLVPEGTRLEYGGWPVQPSDILSPGSIVFVKDERGEETDHG